MTQILFDLKETSPNGDVPIDAQINCYPVARRKDGTVLVTRRGFTERTGFKPTIIELHETALDSAWLITINSHNNDAVHGFYTVPVPHMVDGVEEPTPFNDLALVDPDSLEPDADPDPLWWAMARSTVISGEVNTVGDLILRHYDGKTTNAGRVKGDCGERGLQGEQGLRGVKGDKGDTGVQGVQGAQGAQGDRGIQGIPGVDGIDGIDGVDGTDGAPGQSVTIVGRVPTAANLPATAADGVGYITENDGHLHVFVGGAFIDVGQIKGDKGDTGAQGVKGDQGTKGDKGDTGAQGIQGDKGDKGDKGDSGTPLFIDVLNFGVTGDGVTDDTVAIQTILNNVESAGGGVVWFPKTANSYKISDTLLIPVNTRVEGENKKTLIWGNFNKPLIAGKLNGGTRIDNLELSNLEIVRQGTAKTTPIVDWTGVSHSEIKNVMIRQAAEPAMSIGLLLGAFSYYNRIEGVQIRGCELGVRLIDAANGNIFAGGVSVLFGVRGYHISDSNANYFTGASAERLEGYGVLLDEGAKQNVFVGCRIEYVAEFAFKSAFSTNPAFANYFFGNAMYLGDGVQRYVSQTDNTVVDSNKGYVFSTLEHSTQRNFASYIKSVTQSVSSGGAYTIVPFESVSIDRKNEFDGTTFTAKTSGVYTVTCGMRITSPGTTDEVTIYLRKNGGSFNILGRAVIGTAVSINGTRKVELSAGDTVVIYAQTPAVGFNIVSGANFTWLQIMRDA